MTPEAEQNAMLERLVVRVDVIKWYYERYPRAKTFEPSQTDMEDFAMAFGRELLQAVQERERWISVEERLPEPNWYGLIFTTNDMIEMAYFRRDAVEPLRISTFWQLERTAPQDETINLDLEQVTHWRPLPKPPGEAQTYADLFMEEK